METKRIFRNKYPGVRCSQCGQDIAVGHPMQYAKKGSRVGQKWHAPTCPTALDYQERMREFEQGTMKPQEPQPTTTVPTVPEVKGETTPMETPKPIATTNNGLGEVIAQAVLPYIESKITGLVDEKQVEAIVNKLFEGMVFKTVQTVEIKTPSGEVKDIGLQHKAFPDLLQLVAARLNVWLPGPAGSGKTTACENVAKALDLKFYHCGALDNDYKLMGFINASGQVVSTMFRQWFTEGGVFCGDEIDSWLPSATLALNAALANGHCSFPDAPNVPRHPDAVFIGCANTWGLGATNDYVGRMKQDAAFLDRFVQLDWPYDDSMELALSGNEPWAKRVQSLRAKAQAKGIKVVISPRATYYGATLLASGMPQELVERVTVRKAMTEEQWRAVCA